MNKMLLQGVLQSERTATRKATSNTTASANPTYHHIKSKSSGNVSASQLQAQQLIEQASASAKHMRKSSSTLNMGQKFLGKAQ
jgi:hypothetical protein